MGERNHREHNRTLLVMLLILLCVLLMGAVAYLLKTRQGSPSSHEDKAWDTGLDSSAKGGADPGILIPGYDTVAMVADTSILPMSIGNPKENNCVMTVTLLLEDGTVLYESDILAPGEGMEEISLSRNIQEGTYNVTARFDCYADYEKLKPLNMADSGFVLIAGKGD